MDKLQELARKLHNLVRIGTVSAVQGHTCRVVSGGITTNWLPWLTQRAGNARTWWAPSLGEQVLVLSPGGNLLNGVVLPAVYSDASPAPTTDPAITHTVMPDGTSVSYNSDTHAMTVTVPNDGKLVLNITGSVTVNSPKIDLGESASLEPSVLGNKLAAWVKDELKQWLDTHQHIGNLGAPTSAAMAMLPFDVGTAASGDAVYSTKNRNQ